MLRELQVPPYLLSDAAVKPQTTGNVIRVLKSDFLVCLRFLLSLLNAKYTVRHCAPQMKISKKHSPRASATVSCVFGEAIRQQGLLKSRKRAPYMYLAIWSFDATLYTVAGVSKSYKHGCWFVVTSFYIRWNVQREFHKNNRTHISPPRHPCASYRTSTCTPLRGRSPRGSVDVTHFQYIISDR